LHQLSPFINVKDDLITSGVESKLSDFYFYGLTVVCAEQEVQRGNIPWYGNIAIVWVDRGQLFALLNILRGGGAGE